MRAKNIIIAAVVLGAAVTVMRVKGLSVGDVVRLAKEEIAQSQAETKAVMSGEYTERYARKLNEEAAKLPAANAGAGDSGDPEMNQMKRELAEERKRMLEQRAAAVQKVTGELLTGDVESLKRQVEKQARQRQAGELP
jgi:hypothetical protein